MLNDSHRCFYWVEFTHQFKGSVRVIQIVVTQLLALQLTGRGDAWSGFAGGIEGCCLVGVLTVT